MRELGKYPTSPNEKVETPLVSVKTEEEYWDELQMKVKLVFPYRGGLLKSLLGHHLSLSQVPIVCKKLQVILHWNTTFCFSYRFCSSNYKNLIKKLLFFSSEKLINFIFLLFKLLTYYSCTLCHLRMAYNVSHLNLPLSLSPLSPQ
jgi:hypothetical protein